jgi:hypothetical protein
VKPESEWKKIVKVVLEKPNVKTLGKKLYNYILTMKATCEQVKNKWNHILELEDNDNLFGNIDKITIVSNRRSFQFKFLHRILFFNDRLFKCKITSTTMCDFCNQNLDSIDHRYLYCHKTQEFWRDVERLLRTEYKQDCVIDMSFIVSNVNRDQPLSETVVLEAKYYIFKCFIKKEIPCIRKFKYIIIEMEAAEREIATQKNVLHTHNNKWLI